MRSKDCTQVYLNHYILPSIEYEDEVTDLLYETDDYAKDQNGRHIKVNIKFPEERDTSMNAFIEQFEKGQTDNKKLLEKT